MAEVGLFLHCAVAGAKQEEGFQMACCYRHAQRYCHSMVGVA